MGVGVGDDTLYIGTPRRAYFPSSPRRIGPLSLRICEEETFSPELWLVGAYNTIPLHYFDSITPSPPATDLRNLLYYLWLSTNNNHRGGCERILAAVTSSVTISTHWSLLLSRSIYHVYLSRKNSLCVETTTVSEQPTLHLYIEL